MADKIVNEAAPEGDEASLNPETAPEGDEASLNPETAIPPEAQEFLAMATSALAAAGAVIVEESRIPPAVFRDLSLIALTHALIVSAPKTESVADILQVVPKLAGELVRMKAALDAADPK